MSTLLRDSQLEMAHYLRDPDNRPAPEGVEPRRLAIYQNLIYNNIEGFISGGFPVLRSLYQDDDWHELVRGFIDQHRCHTPYFLEISQEFLSFLMEGYSLRECDPPFMLELAHYEWVELALDVSQEHCPELVVADDILAAVPHISPLAWLLSYQFPVHRIGPAYRPTESVEPTYLVVYRNREETVCFMELNAATARLLDLVKENENTSVQELLATLADELGMTTEAIREFGTQQLEQFAALAIICVNQCSDHVQSGIAPASAGG